MASAMNGATETIRIFGFDLTAADGVIVSVVMTVSRREAAMRSTAGPERTPCVVQASTRLAPASMIAVAAAQTVPAVSIMSSMITAAQPVTSPMMRISSTWFARTRRLSMIASVASRRFAYARARSTPPASGETTAMGMPATASEMYGSRTGFE